jgi:hypothetical protein
MGHFFVFPIFAVAFNIQNRSFVVILSSNSLESGRWMKSENPLIICVIHHYQNPIEFTGTFQ